MSSPTSLTPPNGFLSRRNALGGLLAVLVFPAWSRAASPDELELFRVIAHPDNPLVSVNRDFLAQAFLKKVTRWADGENIRPVDLVASSPVRRAFTENVLRRSVAAVRNYWQQRIFSGRDIPPPEMSSDDAVLRYVRATRGAIGYVSANAKVDGLKVIQPR